MLKRTPDLLKDWDIIWNEKLRECFTIRCNKQIFTQIFG